MAIARVQTRGQVTIPREVRDACGIVPGADLLFATVAPGRFECRVLPPRRSLLELVDEYAVDGVAPDLDSLRQDIAEDIVREQMTDGTPAQAPSP
ncbi:MAG: AbrB/MazE/SpoVT family DNA-binding domain-containing protein [Chloroflexi bacterium]|nr:AbrB/MazE/SpoVT family DNA-binding domain-containing protein [Chloroflexota bacterium]